MTKIIKDWRDRWARCTKCRSGAALRSPRNREGTCCEWCGGEMVPLDHDVRLDQAA
jgi:hypothetical protein